MTSVLTFILLVVLGGGVGLLVVSLAESRKPTADEPSDPRAAHPPEPEPVPEPELVRELVPTTSPSATQAPAPAPARRRRTPERVPRSQVALEGRFADVARVPVWRRLLAVVGIAGISVLSGVVIAVVLAAAIGAAAELLNTAIG